MQDQNYMIPVEDSEFLLLPDNRKVNFHDLRELRLHVEGEIAAWEYVEKSVANKYREVLSKIDAIANSAKDGCLGKGVLSDIKRLLSEWTVTNDGINTCITSGSRLGRYICELRQNNTTGEDFRIHCLAAIIVLGFPHKDIHYTIKSIWAAARVALKFAVPEDLNEKIESYKAKLSELSIESEKIDKACKARIEQFDVDTKEFERNREGEWIGQRNEYLEFLAKAKANVKALEEAYSKKLQLDGPAMYWKKMSRVSLFWGIVYGILDIFATVALALMAYTLLVNGDVLPVFNVSLDKLNLGQLRASLMLLVFTSAWAYVIHVLTRLAISSLHLARDYNERFQLTRVFLALLKNDVLKDDQNIRNIVMQSIFCRSDTGLLKTEGGIKMPAIMDVIGKEN